MHILDQLPDGDTKATARRSTHRALSLNTGNFVIACNTGLFCINIIIIISTIFTWRNFLHLSFVWAAIFGACGKLCGTQVFPKLGRMSWHFLMRPILAHYKQVNVAIITCYCHWIRHHYVTTKYGVITEIYDQPYFRRTWRRAVPIQSLSINFLTLLFITSPCDYDWSATTVTQS